MSSFTRFDRRSAFAFTLSKHCNDPARSGPDRRQHALELIGASYRRRRMRRLSAQIANGANKAISRATRSNLGRSARFRNARQAPTKAD